MEEAYEVADAVRAFEAEEDGSLPALEDELGDLLFQVCFLAMLCEEVDASISLASVARRIHEKLVRRHPHVFGAEQADTADDVRGTWERVKRTSEQRGLFDGIPAAMPSVTQARKIQSRAGGIGFDFGDPRAALAKLHEEAAELDAEIVQAHGGAADTVGESTPPDQRVSDELGDVLFAAVNVARLTRVDPDLALRDATQRFRSRVEDAIALAHDEGLDFADLDLDTQETYYQRAKAGSNST